MSTDLSIFDVQKVIIEKHPIKYQHLKQPLYNKYCAKVHKLSVILFYFVCTKDSVLFLGERFCVFE